MRLNEYLVIFLVILLGVFALNFGEISGYQAFQGINVGIGNVDFSGQNPMNYPSSTALQFSTLIQNIGTSATIDTIYVLAQLYNIQTQSLVSQQQKLIASLSGGGSSTVNFNFGTLPAGDYWLALQVTTAGDSDPNNNEWPEQLKLVASTPPPPQLKADLIISKIIYPGTGAASFTTAQNIEFKVDASNIGNGQTTKPVFVVAKLIDWTGNVLATQTQQEPSGLGAGQTVTLLFSFSPLSASDYGIQLEVMNVDDSNLNNNFFNSGFKVGPAAPPPPPPSANVDLVVRKVNFPGGLASYAQTQNINFDVEAANVGSGSTANPTVVSAKIIDGVGNILYQDTRQDPSGLSANQATVLSFSSTPLPIGDYAVELEVFNADDMNVNNNLYNTGFKVTPTTQPPPSQLPELSAVSAVIKPYPANQIPENAPFSVEFVFKNNGLGSTTVMPDAAVQIVDSAGTTLYQDSVNINKNLAPGAQDTYTFNIPGGPAGNYQLGAGIDYQGLTGDPDLSNNIAIIPISLVSGQTPPTPTVCNNNKVCESKLGEDFNNCVNDCTASSQNVQFCDPNQVDLVSIINENQAKTFNDKFRQSHTVKFLTADKTTGKISVQYDGSTLSLGKGAAYSSATFDILVPLVREEPNPNFPQAVLQIATVCAKHKVQTVVVVPPPQPPSRPPIGPGTGTRPGITGPPAAQVFTITVGVKDKDTKQPIKDAKVNFYLYIKTTDDLGKASFASVPKDKISFKIVKQGFKSFEGEINVSKTETFNFELESGGDSVIAKIVEKAQIVVGKQAEPRDVFTAEILKKSLSTNVVVLKDNEPMLQLGVLPSTEKITSKVELDTDANIFVPSTHSFLVGSACVNKQTKVMLDNPSDCGQGVIPGQARITLKTLHGGKNVLVLIYGATTEDTRLAAQALTRGLSQTYTGKDFRITQELGEIKVVKLA